MRLLVTGNAGAGKSTVAKVLAKKHGHPYFSLDGIVWREGWQKTSRDVRKKEIAKLIAQRNWIIDGVDFDVMDAADMVIFLDYPRKVCFYRALKRNVPYLFSSRPELPRNCPEILILLQLVKIIWRFPGRVRPKILAGKSRSAGVFIHIRSNADLKAYLNGLE